MSRDYRKMKVFDLAHRLAVEAYTHTKHFPVEERFGLQSQIRRAAVSTSTNIVEGSTRVSDKEFARFLTISLGSATEVRYLARLAFEIGLCSNVDSDTLVRTADETVRALQSFITAVAGARPDELKS